MTDDLKFNAQVKRKFFWGDRIVYMRGTRLIYHDKDLLKRKNRRYKKLRARRHRIFPRFRQKT